jgi:starch synthase
VKRNSLKVLLAAAEAAPFAKTGGLGDVTGALLRSLRKVGVDARLLMPLYRGIKRAFRPVGTGKDVTVTVAGRSYRSRLFSHEDAVYFAECNEFFDRPEIYGTTRGDYGDNALRFTFLSRAAIGACRALGFEPDVLHSNDWHTALIPLYLKTTERKVRTGSLLTIHNLGYQGIFPPSAITVTGLPGRLFTSEVLEFHGNLNFLKGGIVAADAVNTVSPTYAREIKSGEYGFGLDGVLHTRGRDLSGIINGLDYETWNPSTDVSIPERYDARDLSGKRACKEALVAACGFSDRSAPVAAFVGRLASQKGVDLLLEQAGSIFAAGLNLAVLGKGSEDLHTRFRSLARKNPGRLHVRIGHDEAFAHRLYAGADMLLIPSRYEPCGLAQMIAMRYGTVPVATATGGIVDTVEDFNPLAGEGAGLLFGEATGACLTEGIKRALCAYADPEKWRGLMLAGMKKEFSWESTALQYMDLYRRIMEKRAAR